MYFVTKFLVEIGFGLIRDLSRSEAPRKDFYEIEIKFRNNLVLNIRRWKYGKKEFTTLFSI